MKRKWYQRATWNIRNEGRASKMVKICVNVSGYTSLKFLKISKKAENNIYNIV